jgi:hypothetical protein
VCACAGRAAVELTKARSNAARMSVYVCWACCGRTHQGEVERSAHECVRVLGVLRPNSPRRGRTQCPACGRPYISTFERRDPKTKIKIKRFYKNLKTQNTHYIQDFYNKNEQNIYKNIYTNRIKYLYKQNKIFTQTPNKNIHKHQIKYLHKHPPT